MADPQIENGHIDIAHEIAEAFMRLDLTRNEWKVLWVIIRKTWGWKKKFDRIPLSQFCEATGLLKPRVCEALTSLLRKSVIFKVDGRHGVNKDFDQWITENRNLAKITENRNEITEIRNENYGKPEYLLRKSVPSKEKKETTKENTSKESFAEGSEERRLSLLLFELIIQNNPKSRLASLNPPEIEKHLQRWSKNIDLMLRRDKRTSADVEEVIRFSQRDGFWRANILSAEKLREKFDQLYVKMTSSRPQAHDNQEVLARAMEEALLEETRGN